MFVGHFALGFGAKRLAPQVSLGILFLASQLADVVWPTLVLLGVESVRIEPGVTALTPLDFVHYPYSHSLLALALWAALFAVSYVLLARAGTKAAIVIAALVLSHWLLDVLTHRPDIPVTIGDSYKVGLGLWNYPVAAVAVELLLFAAGAGVYLHFTKARNRQGSIGFWVLVSLLAGVYIASLLGPPPPSATAVAWSAQGIWVAVALGFWIDRNRINRH